VVIGRGSEKAFCAGGDVKRKPFVPSLLPGSRLTGQNSYSTSRKERQERLTSSKTSSSSTGRLHDWASLMSPSWTVLRVSGFLLYPPCLLIISGRRLRYRFTCSYPHRHAKNPLCYARDQDWLRPRCRCKLLPCAVGRLRRSLARLDRTRRIRPGCLVSSQLWQD